MVSYSLQTVDFCYFPFSILVECPSSTFFISSDCVLYGVGLLVYICQSVFVLRHDFDCSIWERRGNVHKREPTKKREGHIATQDCSDWVEQDE